MEIAAALRQQTFVNLGHSVAVKRVQWDKLGIDGDAEVLQNHLREIVKLAGTVRTLDEVLADYEKNCVRYAIFSHPEYPKRPQSTHLRYTLQNRDKLTRKLEKKKGKSVTYVSKSKSYNLAHFSRSLFQPEVVKYGSEKFKILPEKKKDVYLQAYRTDQVEYKVKVKEFFKNHPELREAQNQKVLKDQSIRRARNPAKAKEHAVLTPFHYYRDQMTKDGNTLTYPVMQKLWKDMSKIEKGQYVSELVNLETKQEKKITTAEIKLMESYAGLPSRPLSAYNIFVQNFRANFEGDTKDFMSSVSAAWKNLNEDEKKQLHMQSDALTENWKRDMEAYIKSLPKEQQPSMFAKYKIFQTKDKSMKRFNQEKTKNEKQEKPAITVHDGPPPNKKAALTMNDGPSPIKKPALTIHDGSPPFKKQKTASESSAKSPERSPKKKNKIKEPEYPSQSTAHYFMTQIYKGKQKKVKKAYEAEYPSQKLIYRQQMKERRLKYIKEVAAYIEQLSTADRLKFEEGIKELKAQQTKDIAWHENKGTDDEHNSNTSDSDSDSS